MYYTTRNCMPTPYLQVLQAPTQLEYYLKPSWRTTAFHSWTDFFFETFRHSHRNQGHGMSWRNRQGSLYLGNLFLEEIHRWHLPVLPRHYETTPSYERFHEQLPPYNQIHLWILNPQEISSIDMKIQVRADPKLSTALDRKPTNWASLLHFHSNHSLKCKESIVFLQGLRYNLHIADDTLLQRDLYSLTQLSQFFSLP